jgi:hypothetical protein
MQLTLWLCFCVLNSPASICRVQITTFNISLVVHGTIAENMDFTEVIKFYL